jgi:hypothetical protein
MQQACKRAAREHRGAEKARGCGERRCGILLREGLGPWSVAECDVGRGARKRKNPTRGIAWQQAVIGTRESLKKRRRKEGCAEISNETSFMQQRRMKALRASPKG